MSKVSFVSKLKHALLEPHYPLVGIEFNSDAIRLAALSNGGDRLSMRHVDSEALPHGVIDINPFKPNVQSLEAAAEALRRLWQRNRVRSTKVCLLLQDRVALTFQLVMEKPPVSREECLDLIKFKVKKSVPFRIEESTISFFNSAGAADFHATSLWATVISDPILHQYEKLVASVTDAQCGLVDLATFNLMNLAHRSVKASALQAADLLYINLNQTYISIAITQSGNLMFYRSRPLDLQRDLAEEAFAEIHPTTMFYVDKLSGQGLAKAYVYAVRNPDEFAAQLERNFGVDTEALTPATMNGQPAAGLPASHLYAPLAGLLASRRFEFQ